MTYQAKDEILADLEALFDQDEKFAYLIRKGRETAPLADELHTEKYLVKGCMSQLWLVPELKEGRVFFQIDSDAAIPKGIAAILAEVYSGLTPSEVLALPADFLKNAGVEEHLSMNRRNGLANLTRQIQMYALAYKALGQQTN